MKRLLLLAALCALLLGCVTSGAAGGIAPNNQNQAPPVQSGGNTPEIVEGGNTGTVLTGEPGENATQGGSATTCRLELNPSTIRAGESTDISFAVSAGAPVEFTYNCGEEIRGISTGGMTGGSRLCQFKTPGQVAVWIKADGKVCAQQALNVLGSDSNKTCSIDQGSIEKNLQDYTYKFTVYFDGMSLEDKIVWNCDRTTATKGLYGDPTMGMTRSEILSCDFNSRPLKDTMEVSVGGVPCGTVSTR